MDLIYDFSHLIKVVKPSIISLYSPVSSHDKKSSVSVEDRYKKVDLFVPNFAEDDLCNWSFPILLNIS